MCTPYNNISHTCIKICTCSYHTFITCAPRLVCFSAVSVRFCYTRISNRYRVIIVLDVLYTDIIIIVSRYESETCSAVADHPKG